MCECVCECVSARCMECIIACQSMATRVPHSARESASEFKLSLLINFPHKTFGRTARSWLCFYVRESEGEKESVCVCVREERGQRRERGIRSSAEIDSFAVVVASPDHDVGGDKATHKHTPTPPLVAILYMFF